MCCSADVPNLVSDMIITTALMDYTEVVITETPEICPGAKVWYGHARANVEASFDGSPCYVVRKEVRDRIAGVNGWSDPHNKGTYSIISETSDTIKMQRVSGVNQRIEKGSSDLWAVISEELNGAVEKGYLK